MSDSAVTLEERVARQETAEEIRELIAAYGRAIDDQDTDALRAIFAEDMVLTAGEVSFRGIEEVVSFYAGYWANYPSVRRHFITNVALHDLSSAGAEATSYFLFLSAAESTPMIGWGRYRDTLTRHADGRLRFIAKDITVELDVDVRAGWAAELAQADATAS